MLHISESLMLHKVSFLPSQSAEIILKFAALRRLSIRVKWEDREAEENEVPKVMRQQKPARHVLLNIRQQSLAEMSC